MFDLFKNIFRKRRLRKYRSDVTTGFVPLTDISVANIIIDVAEPGFDVLKEDILAWSKKKGVKTNIYFFDFRKLGKDELLLTSIQTTIIKRELDWIGMPDIVKTGAVVNEPCDLFISMVNNADFPIEFLGKCSKARFKIGRFGYDGDPYNMVISGNNSEDFRSEPQKIFAAVVDFLDKVR